MMNAARRMIRRFLTDERGSVALEYALTGMVSGGATVISMSMIRKGLDDLVARSDYVLESLILNS